VVLALTPSCPYCLWSMSFYQDMLHRITARGNDLSIIALVDTSAALAAQAVVLKGAGISVDTIMALRLSTIGNRGIPTIVSLDEQGKVQDVWRGLLDDNRERTGADINWSAYRGVVRYL